MTEEQRKLAAEAAGRLQAIADRVTGPYFDSDPEAAHSQADGILCELLQALGMHDVVSAYQAIEPKWYA